MTQNQTNQEELDLSFNFTAILNTQPDQTTITNYLYSFFSSPEDTNLEMRLRVTKQQLEDISEHDFSPYLKSVGDQLKSYKKLRFLKMSEDNNKQIQKQNSELVRCFKQVPYIYFQKNFCLDFENFRNKAKSKEIQNNLNQYLDLIEINLFTQVNHRFNDFFKILQNFQFLDSHIAENIQKLQNMRKTINKFKELESKKGQLINNKIRSYNNKEKILKYLKIMRSLKKLPPTLNSILESSLPYQGISLLGSGKQSYKIVKEINCLKYIGITLQSGDNIIKHSLYKKFSDKTFVYITNPLNPPYVNKFRQIPLSQNMDASHISHLNNSLIQESYVCENFNVSKPGDQSKEIQEEISKTIIQSYFLIDYSNNSQFRIKLIEYLKIISKGFMDQLRNYLAKILAQQSKNTSTISVLAELNSTQKVELQHEIKQTKPIQQPNETLEILIDKISLPYFSKIMHIYHEMFKISLIRFHGCLQKLYKGFKNQNNPIVDRAVVIMEEFLNIFLNLCKFICDKILYILTLKKLSQDTTIAQFYTYISQILFWEDFHTQIIHSQLFKEPTQPNFLTQKIRQYKGKLLGTFDAIKITKQQLQNAYITNLHKNVLTYQIKSSLEDQIWNSVQEIPYHYLNTLNYIINGEDKFANQISNNKSILDSSILNDSIIFSRREKSRIMKISHKKQKQKTIARTNDSFIDIKMVKNAVIINRRHYKVTLSFLLFMEILEQYLKIIDMFPQTKEEMMIRITQITRFFSTFTFQLVLGAGALKLQKIKSKNITARHLCLSCNCLQIINIMLKALLHPEIKKVIDIITNHIEQIAKKLAAIMTNKIENQITALHQINLKSHKSFPTQNTINIITVYKQMFEILQEYLSQDIIVMIMAPTVNLLLRKYFSFLQERGTRGKEQGKYFVQQMSVLTVGFQKQLEFMKKMVSD